MIQELITLIEIKMGVKIMEENNMGQNLRELAQKVHSAQKRGKMLPYVAWTCKIKGMTILYWNTQRMYTPGGQRIIAVPFEEGAIFFDFDRQVNGRILHCNFTEGYIMHNYDTNQYQDVGGTLDEYIMVRDIYAIKEQLLALFT